MKAAQNLNGIIVKQRSTIVHHWMLLILDQDLNSKTNIIDHGLRINDPGLIGSL